MSSTSNRPPYSYRTAAFTFMLGSFLTQIQTQITRNESIYDRVANPSKPGGA